jgi:hypothetical protein
MLARILVWETCGSSLGVDHARNPVSGGRVLGGRRAYAWGLAAGMLWSTVYGWVLLALIVDLRAAGICTVSVRGWHTKDKILLSAALFVSSPGSHHAVCGRRLDFRFFQAAGPL